MSKNQIKGISPYDNVALVTPGDLLPPMYKEQKTNIKNYLKKIGYTCKDLTNCYGEDAVIQRANNLNNAFEDKSIKAVFPICGGERSDEIVDFLDYSLISQNPKIFCGYAGLSYLLNKIAFNARITTFYGPHLNLINDGATKRETNFTIWNYWKLFSNEEYKEDLDFNVNENEYKMESSLNGLKTIKYKNIFASEIYSKSSPDNYFFYNKNAKGKYLEGTSVVTSLNSLEKVCSMLIENRIEDFLLFVDFFDTGEKDILKVFKKISKVLMLQHCSGIIITNLTTHGDFNMDHFYTREEIKSIVDDISVLFQEKLSILYGFPVGHSKYKFVVPINWKVKVNCVNGDITFANPFKI